MAGTDRAESAEFDAVLDRLEVWHREAPAPASDRNDDSRRAER